MIKKSISQVFAILSVAKANSVTTECLSTSNEIGSDNNFLQFNSSMDDIVNKMHENVLWMKTSDMLVCADDSYVHGVRLALSHDTLKDPDNLQKMDNYWSDTLFQDGDTQKFVEHVVGT